MTSELKNAIEKLSERMYPVHPVYGIDPGKLGAIAGMEKLVGIMIFEETLAPTLARILAQVQIHPPEVYEKVLAKLITKHLDNGK